MIPVPFIFPALFSPLAFMTPDEREEQGEVFGFAAHRPRQKRAVWRFSSALLILRPSRFHFEGGQLRLIVRRKNHHPKHEGKHNMGDGLSNNLHSLVVHWDVHCAKEAKDDELRDIYKQCAKQLRQRTEWLEKELTAQPRNEVASILESFMNSGWIERFTLVDDTVKIWHSETGADHANDLLTALPKNSSQRPPSKTEILLRLVCQWIGEQPLGTSQSSHRVERRRAT
jgi:hypothetical protein